MRAGNLRFLVATDVAARGIDLPELSHAILYEPPEDVELYIHRAGRVGRAGGSGVAISLVDVMEKMDLDRITKRYSIEMDEWPLPSDEDVAALVAERVTGLLEARLRDRDKLRIERMERFAPLIHELSESEEGLALLTMLLDDYYQETLHNPPTLPTDSAVRPKSGSSKSSGRKRGGRRGGRRR
jgi:ATP-dependent RNA helicase DeaD